MRWWVLESSYECNRLLLYWSQGGMIWISSSIDWIVSSLWPPPLGTLPRLWLASVLSLGFQLFDQKHEGPDPHCRCTAFIIFPTRSWAWPLLLINSVSLGGLYLKCKLPHDAFNHESCRLFLRHAGRASFVTRRTTSSTNPGGVRYGCTSSAGPFGSGI